MNLRYALGAFLTGSHRFLLKQRGFPLCPSFLGGQEWAYDVCRYAGTRDLAVLVDAGASVGQTALYLRRCSPRAQIHGIELSAQTAVTLRHDTTRYPNIRVHAFALGQAAGSDRT
jgi:hypothetical protein